MPPKRKATPSNRFTPDLITPAHIDLILNLYPETVPSKLHDLDTLRYETIPQALKARRAAAEKKKSQPRCWLEKREVECLVEWKLKHGTYRPTLLALVSSNSIPFIQSTTSRAFDSYASNGDIGAALKTLTAALKGIGPATAALLLSCYSLDTVPFFSDELFRWMHWEGGDGVKSAKKGAEWKRPIAYSAREYMSLVERVRGVRDRLGGEGREVGCVELERVAYVLGRWGVEVDKDDAVGALEQSREEKKVEAESKDTDDRGLKGSLKGAGAKRKEPTGGDIVRKATASKRRRN